MAALQGLVLLTGICATFASAQGTYGYGGGGGGGYRGPPHHPGHTAGWNLKNFSTLVTFGDSYTDDSRFVYFASHNGSAPPVGYSNPANYMSASGGRTWTQYVKQYTGVRLYNYAVSGAVCSDNITPRYIELLRSDFPSVREYEVPAYTADSAYVTPDGKKFLTAPPDETVYSIWIGTNDLGVFAMLTDSQASGTNIANYTDCVYEQLQRLYDQGARYFVIQNVAPLNLAPLYGLPSKGGVTADPLYWPMKPENSTEISYRMMEQVVTVNEIYQYRTPFVARLSTQFPGAKFAVMDMHALMTDIYNNPADYLNGTAPANVTGTAKGCNLAGTDCVASTSPDSFMWYDALHPSEQTDRVIARNFVDVVKGVSKYATYW